MSEGVCVDRKQISCDQEVWVLDQIRTAMMMSNNLRAACRVGADQSALEYALDGVAHGVAVEIIRTLGLEPSFVNIRKHPGAVK